MMTMPPYMTNDRFVWTADEPDAELIEPEILASVDKNWLTFTSQEDCPPQSHCFTLYNYGDHAFAFNISTSDNYAYFVSQISSFQVNGTVFGRQLHALPFVRTTNSMKITVYRRPTNAFKVDEDYPYIKRTSLSVLLFISIFHPALFVRSILYKRLMASLLIDSLQSSKRSLIHLFGTNFSLENSADIRV
ncbi:unnamed protein product [Onchocerca flexuosa]|uniref:MSP domain-containing protein n=1 Tax=Onchocerca flexuosa TaxID=387005 RepID=A0A183I125_9BILA|nr:unnamed protein product [Onchocerca flexuosa]